MFEVFASTTSLTFWPDSDNDIRTRHYKHSLYNPVATAKHSKLPYKYDPGLYTSQALATFHRRCTPQIHRLERAHTESSIHNMGGYVSKLQNLIFAKKETRILILGLVRATTYNFSPSSRELITNIGQCGQDNTTLQTEGMWKPQKTFGFSDY
jgi:hypothetical protein